MKNKLTRLGILFLLGAFFGVAGCSHTTSGGPSGSHVLDAKDHPVLRAPAEDS